MKTKTFTHWNKRVALMTTTGALALAPLFVAVDSAQAQPRRNNPPTWSNANRTLTGTVIRDLAGDSFELRAENGQTYRVRVGRYDEPRSLDRGDRVRVSGRFDGNVFEARNLEFLRDTPNGGGNWNNNQNWLVGTVTRDLRGDSFELRADNGRTYQVRVGRYDEPRSLDRGDRVRVSGEFRNNVFVARNLEFLRDTPNGGGYNNGQDSLTGVIARDLAGADFELRADNGRTYRVSLSRGVETRGLNRGDRVRVSGRAINNVFVARDIDLLRGSWR